ncbi:MAG: hypothetical protein LUO82_00440 [Methanomicrobiales archaeon]|nr:hypothetical protein [Methanomicrobiales archaeon]
MGEGSPVQASVIQSQLQMVELVYSIRIRNIDEVVTWILATAHNDHEAYGMTAAINTWVATRGASGDVEIPRKIFDEISRLIDKKREYLH